MKRLTKISIMLLLLVGVMFTSCDKDDTRISVDPATALVDVSFDINQFIPNTQAKDGDPKGDQTDVIECVEGKDAAYVEITISGTPYTLDLVTLNGGMETEVIKLTADDYTIDDFVVKSADGTALYASPAEGSYYEVLWNLDGVAKPFTVDPFAKRIVTIDVLCYQPYSYEEFGFAWFKYAKYEIKTICFFGNICTKFYKEWHDANGPYAGQTYDGYDFPAIFEVIVRDAGGNAVNDLTINDNLSYFGTGEALCVEYPDLIGADENYTFEIWLHMPDGSTQLIHEDALAEGTSSEKGNAAGFGGEDGVFDYVIGNCSYEGNDANLELPAYIPIPETLTFKYNSGDPTYSKLNITSVTGLPEIASQIKAGDVMDAWCGNKDLPIFVDNVVTLFPVTVYTQYEYKADVYSSLDLPAMPTIYKNYGKAWSVLNWVINNKEVFSETPGGFLQTFGTANVQGLIWSLIERAKDGGVSQVDFDAMLADLGVVEADLAGDFAGASFDGIRDFVPTVGDMAIVLLDPYAAKIEQDWWLCGWHIDNLSFTAEDNFQLMVVQVDP